ncbi:Rossmann-like and DUF2520 domain-containing protein [Sphaerotilaceae bacterium SBD11-9]
MNSIAFIGTGRLGHALASALHQRGVAVAMVANRNAATAQQLAASLPGCRAVDAATAARADLVFLTVRDDALAPLASQLPWRSGQAVVHCSGATEVSVLQPAADAGAAIGGFHPLQIFSDPARAIELLAGSTVAIEGPPVLEDQLRQLATALGMHPLRLPPGSRALYHGGASYAASFLLSMLAEVAEIWRSFGIDEAQLLRAVLPLAHGTLDAAQSKGLSAAVAGPISRGDDGVIARHLAALSALGPEHAALYREFTRRQLALVQSSGRLTDEQAARVRRIISPE